MKQQLAAVLAATLVLGIGSVRTASAAGGAYADMICPEASQYVLAVGKLANDDPPQKIYDAAQAAVDAYGRCSKDKLSNGFREPQHYADTRGAGFAVIAARALIALKRVDDARRELKQYRAIAQNVVDWQTETETSYSAGAGATRTTASGDLGVSRSSSGGPGSTSNGRRPSLYRASAKEIVASIDALLAETGGNAAPAPAASAGH